MTPPPESLDEDVKAIKEAIIDAELCRLRGQIMWSEQYVKRLLKSLACIEARLKRQPVERKRGRPVDQADEALASIEQQEFMRQQPQEQHFVGCPVTMGLKPCNCRGQQPATTGMKTAEAWLKEWNCDIGLTKHGETLFQFILAVQKNALASITPLPPCDICHQPQTQLGAVKFSPTDKPRLFEKTHICVKCDADSEATPVELVRNLAGLLSVYSCSPKSVEVISQAEAWLQQHSNGE